MTDEPADDTRETGRGDANSGSTAGRGEAAARWPIKRFHPGRGQQIGNAVMTVVARWGLIPHTYVMTTRGRKTGTPRSNPVTLVERGENRWLVAPYGPVAWVLNARAAGRVTLSRRGKAQDYDIEELAADSAGPILKDYVQIASATKSYFQATKTSPVAEFTAEASRHPVFALTPATDLRG